jgi:hypothetical protein
MNDGNLDRVPAGTKPTRRVVCSYDTGDEHSLEHYAVVRTMVEQAEADGATGLANYSDHGMDGVALLKDPAA